MINFFYLLLILIRLRSLSNYFVFTNFLISRELET